MDTLLVQEGLKRLDALAAKLGVAANELWAALLAQAPLEWFDVLALLFLCLLMVAFALFFAYNAKRTDPPWSDSHIWPYICAISYTVAFLCMLMSVAEAVEAAKATANPAYYALMQLRGTF